MSKKRLLIICSCVVILAVIVTFTVYHQSPKQTPQSPTIDKLEVLKENARTSKNPFVLQIRKDLNSYLSGKLTGKSNSLLVNGDPKLDRKGFLLTGLKNFSKDYYKSKFVAFKTMPADNGEIVYLEFVDKPDRIFTAGVFPSSSSSYELEYFGQNLQVTQINRIPVLKDREFAPTS